jgi:hypothetical protein
LCIEVHLFYVSLFFFFALIKKNYYYYYYLYKLIITNNNIYYFYPPAHDDNIIISDIESCNTSNILHKICFCITKNDCKVIKYNNTRNSNFIALLKTYFLELKTNKNRLHVIWKIRNEMRLYYINIIYL